MQNNRIDSRARGNAPQMLDKYKKLANDAAMNDDRVQTEYYLQFADHYFRVIADSKAQKEEAQAKRQAERGDNQSDDDDDDDGDDRQDSRQDNRQDTRKPRAKRSDRGPRQDDNRGSRRSRGNEFEEGREGESGDQQDGDNPFTRDDAPKPKAKKPRKKRDDSTPVDNDGGLDPSMLPPAIARADAGSDADGDDAPKKPRKLSTRTRRPRDEDDDGAREAVG